MNLKPYPAIMKAACRYKALKMLKEQGDMNYREATRLLEMEGISTKDAKETWWALIDNHKVRITDDKKLTIREKQQLLVEIESEDQIVNNNDGTFAIKFDKISGEYARSVRVTAEELRMALRSADLGDYAKPLQPLQTKDSYKMHEYQKMTSVSRSAMSELENWYVTNTAVTAYPQDIKKAMMMHKRQIKKP